MSNITSLEPQAYGLITFKTTFGDVDIELFTKQCPKAAQNFVQLCLDGYYKGSEFERVEKDFIAIGGCLENDKYAEEGAELFPDEFHSRLRFTRRGLIATANTKKDENGPKFFFTLGPAPELQNKHTIFGRVIGNSVYSLVNLNECHVDDDCHPIRAQTIDEILIVDNPFPDLVPRKTRSDEKEASSSVFADVYDPLLKPKPEKSKKLSFYDDDGDESDDGNDKDNTDATRKKLDFARLNDLDAVSVTNKNEDISKPKNERRVHEKDAESPHKEANKLPSSSKDDAIDAKEKRLREIRAEIQKVRQQIEGGTEPRAHSQPARKEKSSRAEDRKNLAQSTSSARDDSSENSSGYRDSKVKTKREKIELVTNFATQLKQPSTSSRRVEEKPAKKQKVEPTIEPDELDTYAQELEALDALNGDDWMTHKFETDD